MNSPPPPPPPPPAMSGCASLATRRYLSLASLSSLHAHYQSILAYSAHRSASLRPRRRQTRTRGRGTAAEANDGHSHCATHFLVPGSCLIQMHVIGSFGWGKQTLTHGLAYDCHNLDLD